MEESYCSCNPQDRDPEKIDEDYICLNCGGEIYYEQEYTDESWLEFVTGNQ